MEKWNSGKKEMMEERNESFIQSKSKISNHPTFQSSIPPSIKQFNNLTI